MKPLYFDHAATTPLNSLVAEEMTTFMHEQFANPSSIHQFGRQARQTLDSARLTIAQVIGASEKDVFFTSGGTESDNLAIIGTALENRSKGNHIITTQIEHHAVLDACHYLESIGFDVTYLPVDESGLIQLEDLKAALREETILVSVMMINNEVGSIQPIQAIGELLTAHACYFHTDAVQALGIVPIDVTTLKVDLMTLSAHKINGPKGIGVLYKHKEVALQKRQFGGAQERLKRPGTENMLGIVGFQKAITLIEGKEQERHRYYQALKRDMMKKLRDKGIDFDLNGDFKQSTPLILNISFKDTKVEQLLMNLDMNGILISSGSACTAGSVNASHVLSAMFGQNHERTTNAIRFSFGVNHDTSSIEEAVERISTVVKRLVAL